MIPTVADVASDALTHRFGDVFNPPALTNFIGCVQADLDPTGIRSLNFPPFATSDHPSGNLYLDGRYFPTYGAPVMYRWRPDRIVREADVGDLHVTTVTSLVVGRMAVIVAVEIENRGPQRDVAARIAVRGSVTQSVRPWDEPLPPYEADNQTWLDAARAAYVFTARASDAVSVQGLVPPAQDADGSGLRVSRRLAAGERLRFAYVQAIAAREADAIALYDEVAQDVDGALSRTTEDWDRELRAIFTPGNDRYSGSLPELVTDDEDLQRLYLMGVLGVTMFRRDTYFGRAYSTLMPRYWPTVTFLWDYSLSSPVHALLDPDVMRRYLEHWMESDIHSHMGTEWLTAKGVGMWYSVNDFAMTRIAREYLRWSGDLAWLDAPAGGRPVIDQLVEYARAWEAFRAPSGLADYGGIGNLLECVSTYVHEVASLNAANVYCLRTVAELLEARGDADGARAMRVDAAALVARVHELYAGGEGYWHARFPDGRLVPVRHAYDLLTVSTVLCDELSGTQKREMVEYFQRELQTPTWMRALSDRDPDAIFSVRPDHQWNGAYTAWPSETAAGLYRIGADDVAAAWVRGLAKTANQGPFGQAHFTETFAPPDRGGALKAAAEMPYINDWACSSGGSWANLVIGSIFGVDPPIDGELHATPRLDPFDPGARLRGLRYRGRLYDVDRDGVHLTTDAAP